MKGPRSIRKVKITRRHEKCDKARTGEAPSLPGFISPVERGISKMLLRINVVLPAYDKISANARLQLGINSAGQVLDVKVTLFVDWSRAPSSPQPD